MYDKIMLEAYNDLDELVYLESFDLHTAPEMPEWLVTKIQCYICKMYRNEANSIVLSLNSTDR